MQKLFYYCLSQKLKQNIVYFFYSQQMALFYYWQQQDNIKDKTNIVITQVELSAFLCQSLDKSKLFFDKI